MNFELLLEQVKDEVMPIFKKHKNSHLAYHNLNHTLRVTSQVSLLGKHYELNERDYFVVMAAAWYHDIGYLVADGDNHEIRGADMAEKFLRSKGVDESIILEVRNCILATKLPQHANNLMEQIVCDADLFHFGTNEFDDLNADMRKEAEWRKGKKITKSEWRNDTIALLTSHQFQTDYARQLLDATKEKNLERLKRKQMEASNDNVKPNDVLVTESSLSDAVKESKSNKPDKGIETMFRVSSNNHQRLSDMADNKAHIMITTTSIIISVLLSLLLRKLEDNPQLIFPTVLLLAVCVVTMVFSILATRPSLTRGTFSQKDLDDRNVNLLFFGNFYNMNFDEYYNGMKIMMNDKDFLYGSLTRDLYSQGVVLGKKYKLLRYGYNIFMFGIVASVLAFIVAVIIR